MMRILFCDDERIFLDHLTARASEILQSLKISAEVLGCGSGRELMEELSRKPADAVFLDIDMPEISGFEAAGIAGRLPDHPRIIFLSSMEHLVYESFAYQPFWFLRKSDLERLPEVMKKLVEAVNGGKRAYSFESNGKKHSVLLKDILYFESSGHYVTLCTKDKNWTYKEQIGNLEQLLSPRGFLRCHVGFLVNFAHIAVVKKNAIELRSGQTIPISRNRQKETEKKFMEYMRSVQL